MSKIIPTSSDSDRKIEKRPINKKKHRFGKGLIAGAIFGIAAGIFMSSREGKSMAKKLEASAKGIEAKLRGELMKKKDLTEGAYSEAIDSILAYYAKSKKIAKSEIPSLKKYLEDKWDLVKDEMQEVRETQVAKAKKKTSKK